jgi:uncharacterized Tic20 family protein
MLEKIRRLIDRHPLAWVLSMTTISVICTVLCLAGVITAFVYSSTFALGVANALFPMLLVGINMVALVANVQRLSELLEGQGRKL